MRAALCSTVCEEKHGILVCTERCFRQVIVSGTEADGKRRVPGKAPERKAGAQPWLHCRAHLVAAGRVKRFGPAKERGKENLRAPVSAQEQKGGIERGFKPRARERGRTRLADAPQAKWKDCSEAWKARAESVRSQVSARGNQFVHFLCIAVAAVQAAGKNALLCSVSVAGGDGDGETPLDGRQQERAADESPDSLARGRAELEGPERKEDSRPNPSKAWPMRGRTTRPKLLCVCLSCHCCVRVSWKLSRCKNERTEDKAIACVRLRLVSPLPFGVDGRRFSPAVLR